MTATESTASLAAHALRYPTEERLAMLETYVDASANGTAKRELNRFLAGAKAFDIGKLEEMFTETFDLSPKVVLYVGHLAYGDSYERGTFMSELQAAMRELDVDMMGELPDHLEPILRYLAATDEPIDVLGPILVPAVTKMEKTLKKADSKNPYLHVLTAARIAAEESMR